MIFCRKLIFSWNQLDICWSSGWRWRTSVVWSQRQVSSWSTLAFNNQYHDDHDADAQGRSLAMSRPTRKLRAMGNLGSSPPIWSPLFSRYTWSLFKRFDDDRHGHHDDFKDHHDFYLMVMMNIAKWRWRWYWWASGNENEHGIFPGTWDRLTFWRSRLSRR